MNSPDHSTKGTPSPRPAKRTSRALTAGKCRVSGSISFPLRGAFHLSLTVLVHYRWPKVVRLGRWSSQLPTGFLVSRGTQGHLPTSTLSHQVRDSHPLWCGFPDHFPSGKRRRCWRVATPPQMPYNPSAGPSLSRPGLGSSRLARHYYGTLS